VSTMDEVLALALREARVAATPEMTAAVTH